MNTESIKHIKEGNQKNIESLNRAVINKTKYNDYQSELNKLSTTLKADSSNSDLLISLEKLINSTKQTDNGLDRLIKSYYDKIKTADFTQVGILKSELQTKIEDRKNDLEKAYKKYQTEKRWISQKGHEKLYHENNNYKLELNKEKEYNDGLLTEISNLETEIFEIAKKLRQDDPNFNKNSGVQDYMGNKDDLDQAKEMAYNEIMQTNKYMDNFSKSNSLKMTLPGGAGNLTFKNQADKLLYTKLFLETLRNGLNDNSDDIITGYLAIGGGVIVGGYITKLVFKRIIYSPIKGIIVGVKDIITGKGKETSGGSESQSSSEKVTEGKESFTRNQKLELIEKYKNSKLKTNTRTYNEVYLELDHLEKKVREGKLDKLNKIQFGDTLMYLDTESHLEYRGGKSVLGIKSHKMKQIDIRSVESFIKEVEVGEQKSTYTFDGSTEIIEYPKGENLDRNFNKIEGHISEIEKLNKAKELQIEYNTLSTRLIGIQSTKATIDSTLNTTTGSRTQTIENPTYKQILIDESNIQDKIEKAQLEYTKLGYSDITTYDLDVEIQNQRRLITTEVNRVNRTIGLTRGDRITLSESTSWIKELKTDIIKALKHR